MVAGRHRRVYTLRSLVTFPGGSTFLVGRTWALDFVLPSAAAGDHHTTYPLCFKKTSTGHLFRCSTILVYSISGFVQICVNVLGTEIKAIQLLYKCNVVSELHVTYLARAAALCLQRMFCCAVIFLSFYTAIVYFVNWHNYFCFSSILTGVCVKSVLCCSVCN